MSSLALLVQGTAPLWAQTGPQARNDLAGLIQEGNRKEALEAIRSGTDVDGLQPDGTSPLHWAVLRVDYELLEELIQRGANPSITNLFGSTPIAEAARMDDAKMVKMLLDAGAEPEGPNADGQTALMLAIKTGNMESVRMLLDAGANVNNIETFRKQTPLMWAVTAARNAPQMVDLLLSRGADFEARSLFIDWPSQISSEPRAQYRPVGGLTVLLYAVRSGCFTCVESLINAGVDPDIPTPEGVTPLMMAIDNGHNEIAKLLLENGADPGVWDWWGRTALYIAVDRKDGSGSPARLEANGEGQTVPHMELITMMLEMGVSADPELNMHRPSRGGNSGRFGDNQMSTGCTPLYRAVQSRDSEVIQVLLEYGANPNIRAMGFTPFLLASGVNPGGRGGSNFDQSLLDLMISHGADVNSKVIGTETYTMRVARAPSTNEGTSALHTAVQRANVELVEYLLDHGADPNLLDAEGHRPIDLIALLRSPGGAELGQSETEVDGRVVDSELGRIQELLEVTREIQ